MARTTGTSVRSGGRGKPRVRIQVKHPGSLGRYGYRLNEPPEKRRGALRKAANAYGYAEVISKLTPLVAWHKRRGRDYRRIAKSDEQFLRKLHDQGEL